LINFDIIKSLLFYALWYSANTTFNLSPRGHGRASFRTAEIVQIGRIPIYLYDDHPWIPYEDSPYSLYHIGYVVRWSEVSSLLRAIAALSSDDIYRQLLKVANARYFYTHEGIINQISMFISDPFGQNGGYLRCSKYQPINERLSSALDAHTFML
jgi:hypothetical protein